MTADKVERSSGVSQGRQTSRGAELVLPRPNPCSQLQPLVPPQVLHFMQVPLRTNV